MLDIGVLEMMSATEIYKWERTKFTRASSTSITEFSIWLPVHRTWLQSAPYPVLQGQQQTRAFSLPPLVCLIVPKGRKTQWWSGGNRRRCEPTGRVLGWRGVKPDWHPKYAELPLVFFRFFCWSRIEQDMRIIIWYWKIRDGRLPA